jgi:hypothetical protein
MAAVRHAHVMPLVAARMLPPGPPQRSGAPVPARAAAHRGACAWHADHLALAVGDPGLGMRP